MEVFRTVEEEEELVLSECSSGCESGWTVYLDESEGGPWEVNENEAVCSKSGREEGGEDEENMSTVSDASSAPPVFQGTDVFSGSSRYYYCCCCCYHGCELDSGSCRCRLSTAYRRPPTACGGDQHGTKRRRVEQQQENKHLRMYHSFRDLLEDTATSLPGYHSYADPNSISCGSCLPAADTNLRLSIARSSPTPTRGLKTIFSTEEHALSSTTSFMARTNPKQE